MPRPVWSESELELASDELQYEVWMLYETARRLVPPPGDLVLNNALVEAFTLHVRVLLDFFDPRPGVQDDDIIAADFCSTGWIRPGWSVDMDDFRMRANKRVAHLTHKRPGYIGTDREWNLGGLVDAFDGPLADFERFADRGHPGPRWTARPEKPPLEMLAAKAAGHATGGTGPTGTNSPMIAADTAACVSVTLLETIGGR